MTSLQSRNTFSICNDVYNMCVHMYIHVHVYCAYIHRFKLLYMYITVDDSGATPTSSAAPAGQSLFSRLVNAITPAHLTRRPSKQLHESTPQLSSNNTPGTRNLISTSDRTAAAAKRSKFKTPSTRPRARPELSGSKSSVAKVRLSANDVAVGREKDIEMKDFSTSLRKRKNRLSTSFSTEKSKSSPVKINTVTGIPNLRFDSRSPIPENCTLQITSCGCGLDYSPYVHTPGNHGDGDTPKQGTPEASSMTPTQRQPVVRRRRSVRIAKRRSMTQGGGVQSRPSPLVKEGVFPVPSVLSPVSGGWHVHGRRQTSFLLLSKDSKFIVTVSHLSTTCMTVLNYMLNCYV